jgi:CxxC-x17-CxxC domain-containing protein
VARKTRQVERGLGQMAPGFRELRDQQQTTTICGSCGGPAVVPFAVRRNRAVYCTDCFQRRRAAAE